MHCSKFAGAAQHFLLLLQKKTLAKEKEPEGISISPQTPLNRPEKPLRFFWTFPAIAEKPMRIRTAQFLSAGRFTANIQTQLLTNPLSRIRRRVAETRKVTTEWNAKLKYWCLPEFRRRKHPTVTQRPFSPPSFPARRKRRGRRRHRAVANLQQPLSLGCAEPAPLEGEPFVWLRETPLPRGLRPSWGWRGQRRGG